MYSLPSTFARTSTRQGSRACLKVIVGLFLWFLSGVFSLYALDNDTIIIAVKAAFDPFILPLLSTHMGLTFLSYGLEKAFGEGDPEDDGGFRL